LNLSIRPFQTIYIKSDNTYTFRELRYHTNEAKVNYEDVQNHEKSYRNHSFICTNASNIFSMPSDKGLKYERFDQKEPINESA